MATDLEVFRATVNQEPVDRILFYFDCVDDLQRRLQEHVGEGVDFRAKYGCWARCSVGPGLPGPEMEPDYERYYRDEPLPDGAWIDHRGIASVPSGFYHFTGYVSPLRNATSLRELEEYPWPFAGALDGSGCRSSANAAHERGEVAVSWIGHIYENAWQIRGYEQFLMDMVERPEWAQCLLDRLAEAAMARVEEVVPAGVDLLECGDDVANQNALMFSPEMWRRFMKPCWERVWARARELNPGIQIKYHSDGDVMEIIPELIEMGMTVLNPLQPECLDIDDVHRRWGNKITFDGCIGTQTTMPFGSPDDVRRRVREVIRKYGRNGGLIVSPTHILEPEVPIENIEALVEACREGV